MAAVEAGLHPVPGYRTTSWLGAGAFAEVWEAQSESDGHRVALKFLDCRVRSASMVASEVRFFRALTELRHPHIIPLLGVHSWGRYLVLVMELANGSVADLHAAYRKETGGNVPSGHALELLDQAASALDFLARARLPGLSSARGLQHCDIKPSNLLLVGNKLKVGDFGLCAGAGYVTHTSGWKGTLPYAAPELFHGSAAPGTDQYALAVTFCELVLGERAFWKSQADINSPPTGLPVDMTKVREKEFPVLTRAMHTYPSSRWPSCRDFLQALRKAIEAQRPADPPDGAEVRIYPRGMHGSLRDGASNGSGGGNGPGAHRRLRTQALLAGAGVPPAAPAGSNAPQRARERR